MTTSQGPRQPLDELSYTIQQLSVAIANQHAKVTALIADLAEEQNWTDGHIAEGVAHLSSMIAERFALRRAMRMLNKQELEKQG